MTTPGPGTYPGLTSFPGSSTGGVGMWISLGETKAHLNKSGASTADDAELNGFILAACAMIEDLKGHVDPVAVQTVMVASRALVTRRWWHGWVYTVELPETPVLSVDLVEYGGPVFSTVSASADPSVPGWWLRDTVVHVPFPGEYRVSYTAGRNPLPPNYRLAALELVAHLWRGSQLNQSQGRPQSGGGDQMQIVPRIASALPYRVRELLGIYGNVVSDDVVLA